MTWRQLADLISKMSPNQVEQAVRFVEPYDEGRDGYLVELIVAKEDIYIGPKSEEIVFVKAGEPSLG